MNGFETSETGAVVHGVFETAGPAPETSTRTFYVVQESWDGSTWHDLTRHGGSNQTVSGGASTIEAARVFRDRMAKRYAEGDVYEMRRGDAPVVPKFRIMERVSTWTVVE